MYRLKEEIQRFALLEMSERGGCYMAILQLHYEAMKYFGHAAAQIVCLLCFEPSSGRVGFVVH
jgi:hypothetical protein